MTSPGQAILGAAVSDRWADTIPFSDACLPANPGHLASIIEFLDPDQTAPGLPALESNRQEELEMFKLFASPRPVCAEVGKSVSVDQTQEQCRRQHACDRSFCPLRLDFIDECLDSQLQSFRRA